METTCPACGHAFEVEPDRLTSDVHFGDFVIDLDKGILARDNEELVLPLMEYQTLAYLVANRTHVASQEAMYEGITGEEFDRDRDQVRVVAWIHHLRARGFDGFIQTYEGRGYRFIAEGTAAPLRRPQTGS